MEQSIKGGKWLLDQGYQITSKISALQHMKTTN